MGQYFKTCPEMTLNLFDTLIKPILLYAPDFWGCLKIPHNNPIENTHMRFCKDLLGVQRQTSNIGVLLELERVPIMIYGKKNCVKNWVRINVCEKANEIVISANKTSIRQGLLWNQSVINCLNNM